MMAMRRLVRCAMRAPPPSVSTSASPASPPLVARVPTLPGTQSPPAPITAPGTALLCLVGDSHVRNLHNSIAAALLGGECDPTRQQLNKSICEVTTVQLDDQLGGDASSSVRATTTTTITNLNSSSSGSSSSSSSGGSAAAAKLLRFYRVNFARDLEALKVRAMAGCGTVLLSFGLWGLSYARAQGGPISAEQATREARYSASWLEGVRARFGVPVAWLALNPTPLFVPFDGHAHTLGSYVSIQRMNHCPPGDWRTPHHVSRRNDVVRAVMLASPNITYLDSWPFTFHLFDLSFDGLHYQQPVGRELARLVLDWWATMSAAAAGRGRGGQCARVEHGAV